MGASTRGEPQPAEEHTVTPYQSRRFYLPGLRVCVRLLFARLLCRLRSPHWREFDQMLRVVDRAIVNLLRFPVEGIPLRLIAVSVTH